MNEVTLMTSKVNPKAAKTLFIVECVLCAPFIFLAFFGAWIGLIFLIGPIWTYYCYRKSKDIRLVITDKRILATGGMFGSETTIPMDSISAVSTKFPRTVKITSSSGIIAISFLEDYVDVYDAITKLINSRVRTTDDSYPVQAVVEKNVQEEAKPNIPEKPSHTPEQAPLTSETMELLHNYKKLLDEGILTQEEFDAKKKELLGL